LSSPTLWNTGARHRGVDPRAGEHHLDLVIVGDEGESIALPQAIDEPADRVLRPHECVPVKVDAETDNASDQPATAAEKAEDG